jgi:raffinose/stachyose/melibiose transport system permease protein
MNWRLRSTFTCYTVVLPSLALLFTFVYLPVFWAFSKSLYEFEVGGAARFVGLSNYTEYLFRDPTCWPSLLNMLMLTAFAVCVRLSFPLVVARLIYSLPSERSRHFYRVLFLAPIVVPGVAAQLIWQGMIYGDRGLLNELLRAIGLGGWATGWLSNPHTALAAVALVGFPFIGGFEVLVYYAGFANIPTSVNEAATLEGCTGVRKFFLIDLPMVMSQIKLILILTIIGGIQAFQNIFILTRGGPGFKTNVPGMWMYLNAFSFQRMGYACAIGVLLFLMILVLTIINMKYFKSAEQLQGKAA